MCSASGIAYSPPTRPLDDLDAADIASDVVTRALEPFRQLLKRGGWDSDRGASLNTFFIRQCLFHFPNALRAHLSADPRLPTEEFTDAPALDCGTALRVALDRQLEHLRNELPTDARWLRALRAYGFTHAEIGELIGRSERAVESMLQRGRIDERL